MILSVTDTNKSTGLCSLLRPKLIANQTPLGHSLTKQTCALSWWGSTPHDLWYKSVGLFSQSILPLGKGQGVPRHPASAVEALACMTSLSGEAPAWRVAVLRLLQKRKDDTHFCQLLEGQGAESPQYWMNLKKKKKVDSLIHWRWPGKHRND